MAACVIDLNQLTTGSRYYNVGDVIASSWFSLERFVHNICTSLIQTATVVITVSVVINCFSSHTLLTRFCMSLTNVYTDTTTGELD